MTAGVNLCVFPETLGDSRLARVLHEDNRPCCLWASTYGHQVGRVEVVDAEALKDLVEQVLGVVLQEGRDCIQDGSQFGMAVHIATVENALADLRCVHLESLLAQARALQGTVE